MTNNCHFGEEFLISIHRCLTLARAVSTTSNLHNSISKIIMMYSQNTSDSLLQLNYEHQKFRTIKNKPCNAKSRGKQ